MSGVQFDEMHTRSWTFIIFRVVHERVISPRSHPAHERAFLGHFRVFSPLKNGGETPRSWAPAQKKAREWEDGCGLWVSGTEIIRSRSILYSSTTHIIVTMRE